RDAAFFTDCLAERRFILVPLCSHLRQGKPARIILIEVSLCRDKTTVGVVSYAFAVSGMPETAWRGKGGGVSVAIHRLIPIKEREHSGADILRSFLLCVLFIPTRMFNHRESHDRQIQVLIMAHVLRLG